jgi:hypothetical protein
VRGFLGGDCGLIQTSGRTSRRKGLSRTKKRFLHNNTRLIPALRAQYLYCALARFQWPNFGDQRDTWARIRSDEKEDA